MYWKFLKFKLRMISNLSLLVFQSKSQLLEGKRNQFVRKKIREHKLNADFLIVPFYKTHKPLHENADFSFQFLQCYECIKEAKCTKSTKKNSFYFLEMRNTNNYFSFEGKMTNEITISPIRKRIIYDNFLFQKKMYLMQQRKYFEINSSMIKKNALNKH